MSTPPAICLDTQVYESLNYNFAAPVLQHLVKLCKEHALKLLLPAPIKDEVERHMLDRARELEAALDKVLRDAQRKCSYLSEWERFPREPLEKPAQASLDARCQHAWGAFTRQFNVIPLKYDGVSLDKVMLRYHYIRPPFGAGDKRKEFPDAISLEILDVYARKHSTTVAVVSGDNGMKDGCNSYHNLLHFPTLPRLIETILSEDKRVELYLNVINANMYSIEAGLDEEVHAWCHFAHDDSRYTKVQDRVGQVAMGSFDIIGLGINECTIAFSAGFRSEHELQWEDVHFSDPEGRPYDMSGWIAQKFDLGGTVKVKFSEDDKEMVSCKDIALDSYTFMLTATPTPADDNPD